MKKSQFIIYALIVTISISVSATSTETCDQEKQRVEQATIERCMASGVLSTLIASYTLMTLYKYDAGWWYVDQAMQYVQTDYLLPDGSRMPEPDASWYQICIGQLILALPACSYLLSHTTIYDLLKAIDRRLQCREFTPHHDNGTQQYNTNNDNIQKVT